MMLRLVTVLVPMSPVNVGEDCPVFDGLFEFCQLSTSGSMGTCEPTVHCYREGCKRHVLCVLWWLHRRRCGSLEQWRL